MSAFVARLPRVPRAVRLPLVAETGALALVVALAAYVYTRDLHTYPNFDEGNYLGSLDALRHGQALGRDVFLDQPPGWYLLLVAVSYPFGNSVSGVRTGLMVVTLIAILAAYVCGRLAGGPIAGLVAAGVMAVARPLPGFAGLVESEPASAALAVVAVALAVYAYHRRFRPWAAFAAGVVLAASTAVKLPGATAALPIAALADPLRIGPLLRRLLLPVAGAAAVCVALVLAYRHAFRRSGMGSSCAYADPRVDAPPLEPAPRRDVRRSAHPFGCLVIGGALASLVVAVRGRDRRLLGALWLWSVAGYAFVLAMHPLSDHHLVFLAVSLALPAGVGLGLLATHAGLQRAAVAALLLVIAAFFAAGVVKDRNEIVRCERSGAAGDPLGGLPDPHAHATRPARRLGSADRAVPRTPPDAGPTDRHVDRANRPRRPAAAGRAPVDRPDETGCRHHRPNVPD